jgi:predicted DNA-binding transcriptional regulator AlpA
MYVGISASKFDELVADGRMPKPIKIDSRNVWDMRDLDLAFDAPKEDAPTTPNSWEGV